MGPVGAAEVVEDVDDELEVPVPADIGAEDREDDEDADEDGADEDDEDDADEDEELVTLELSLYS